MTITHARSTASLGIVAMLLALCGCSTVRMSVNAYLSGDLSFPEAGADTTIGVVVHSLPNEPLLNAEIDQKVTLLLQGRGYAVASPDHADYVLVCGASIDAGMTETDFAARTAPGRYAHSYVVGRRGHIRTIMTYIPGETFYVPYTYTVYTKRVVLTLLKKELVPEPTTGEREQDLANATVWRCVTVSTGESTDLRWIVNHMLLASFDRYGQDTGYERRVLIPMYDKRVRVLASGGR